MPTPPDSAPHARPYGADGADRADGPDGADADARAAQAPARDLAEALARMTFRVEPEFFRLVALPPAAVPAGDPRLALPAPSLVVHEPDETTVLAPETAVAALARLPGAVDAGRFGWITFEAPMGWEVVGFLARISAHLARAGIPIGCVASHRRDHLFIAEPYLDRARAALAELFPEGAPAARPPGRGPRDAAL